MNESTEFLKLSTMCLGTCGPDGTPHTAPIYFVAEGDHRMYFYSKPSSQHIQDINENPRTAGSIYPECFDWDEIRGVQMTGVVEEVKSSPKQKSILKDYKTKFPFVSQLGVSLSENKLYVFRATWVRIIDNRIRFGYKKEFSYEMKEE